MDVLTDVLNSLHLKSSLYCRSELGTPWGLHFLPMPCAVFHVLHQGQALLRIEGTDQLTPVSAGDVIVIPHGEGHLILDAPDSPVFRDLRVDQWGECALMRWSETPKAVLLCGTFELAHDADHPILGLMPRLLHIHGQAGRPHPALAAVLAVMATEAESGQPGSQTVLRRLTDILFIQIVRHWLETQQAESQSWLGALRDPQIGKALGLIHQALHQGWSVASLATEVAMSRSAFAARFTQLVGEPPLQYLTRWRMNTAARLLRNQQLGLGEVAMQVGYESDVTFSKAFKRQIGVAPGVWRRSRSAVIA